MKSPDNMIVTLVIRQDEVDMELPSFLPIGELAEKIAETLENMDSDRFYGLGKITLRFQGVALNREKTLASCGVWDGSILECEVGPTAGRAVRGFFQSASRL